MKHRLGAAIACLALLVTAGARARADERAEAAPPRSSVGRELAVAIGATTLTAPAVYAAARLVGTSSPNQYTSIGPALVMATVLPPAVATAMVGWERRRAGAPRKVLAPFLFATAAQALVLTASFFAKTWVEHPGELVLLSAATGGACGSAATLGAEIAF